LSSLVIRSHHASRRWLPQPTSRPKALRGLYCKT